MRTLIFSLLLLIFQLTPLISQTGEGDTVWTKELWPKESYGAVFGPGDSTIIAAMDNSIVELRTDNGKEIRAFQDYWSKIVEMKVAGDFKYIYTRHSNRSVLVWDYKTGEIVKTLPFDFNNDAIGAIELGPDNKIMYLGSMNKDTNNLIIYDLENDKEIKRIDVPGDGTGPIAASPDGKLLAVANTDFLEDEYCEIRLFDAVNYEYIKQWAHFIDGITSIKFSPDSKYIAEARAFLGVGRIWNLDNIPGFRVYNKDNTGMTVGNFAFSDNMKYVVISNGYAGTVTSTQVWDFNDNSLLYHYNWLSTRDVNLSNNNEYIICVGNKLTLLNFKTEPKEVIEQNNNLLSFDVQYNGSLQIFFNQIPEKEVNIFITDIQGNNIRDIFKWRMNSDKLTCNLDLISGTYFVTMKYCDEILTKKFIVTK